MTVTESPVQTHGAGGYCRGCRCGICRRAHALSINRWRVKRARRGTLVTDAALTAERLRSVYAAVGSWQRVGNLLGCSLQAAWHLAHQRRMVRLDTAAKVEELWNVYCAPIERDRRRWPVGPLLERIHKAHGSLNALPNGNMRRNLYRAEWLTSATADRYAVALGWLPDEIWPDWYEEEVA